MFQPEEALAKALDNLSSEDWEKNVEGETRLCYYESTRLVDYASQNINPFTFFRPPLHLEVGHPSP